MTLLSKHSIVEVIPQKDPFVMIDNLISADKKGFRSSFKPSDNNIFAVNGKIMEPLLIENVAQTVAAGFGYVDRQTGGKPKVGFIGAISKLKIHQLPNVNDEINTVVTHINQFENVHLVKGENFVNDAKLSECEMKIVVQE